MAKCFSWMTFNFESFYYPENASTFQISSIGAPSCFLLAVRSDNFEISLQIRIHLPDSWSLNQKEQNFHFFTDLYFADKKRSSLDTYQWVLIYHRYRSASLSYIRFLPFFSFFSKFIQICIHSQFFLLHFCKIHSQIDFCKFVHFYSIWKIIWFLKK